MEPQFISASDNSCVITTGQSTCVYDMELCLDCSCDEIAEKGRICERMLTTFLYYSEIRETYVDSVVLCVGLVANFLLLLTLMQKSFRNAVTFIYIRTIAAIGLALIFVQIALKIADHRLDQNPEDVLAEKFALSFEYTTDFAKLFMSTLSTFLCFDRLTIIVAPMSHRKLDNFKFVLIAGCVSVVVSCLVVVQAIAIETTMDEEYAGIELMEYYDKDSLEVLVVERLIWAVRVLEALLMISFTVVIVIRMRARSRRLQSVMAGEASSAEERRTNRLCKFQIIETTVVSVDLSMLCLNEFVSMLPSFRQLGEPHTFQVYLSAYSIQMFYYVTLVVQELANRVSQFVLFFLYLGFSPVFRNRFLGLIRCQQRNSVTIEPLTPENVQNSQRSPATTAR